MVKNTFKFTDCVDCVNVGGGTSKDVCFNCMIGENFEERAKDIVEEMMLSETDREVDHGY